MLTDEGVQAVVVQLPGFTVVARGPQVNLAGLECRAPITPPHDFTCEHAEFSIGQDLGDVDILAVGEVEVNVAPLQVKDHLVVPLTFDQGFAEGFALAELVDQDHLLASHVCDVGDGGDEAADSWRVGDSRRNSIL